MLFSDTIWIDKSGVVIIMSEQKEPNKFGKYLRSYRKNEKGLSLRDFSDLTGISFSHLSKIERGEYTPSRSTIAILADTLNIEKDKLLLLGGFAPDNHERIITRQHDDVMSTNLISDREQMQILHQLQNDYKTIDLFKTWKNMNDEQRKEALNMVRYILYKGNNTED